MRYGVNAYAHVSHTHTFINKPNPVAQLSATGVCEKNAHVRPSSLPHDHERPPIPHTMLTVCRTRCLLTGGRFFQFLVALPPNMAIQHCIWGQGGGPNIKKNDLGCRSISGKNGRFFRKRQTKLFHVVQFVGWSMPGLSESEPVYIELIHGCPYIIYMFHRSGYEHLM